MRSHKHKHKHADNSDDARSIEMHIVLLWQKKAMKQEQKQRIHTWTISKKICKDRDKKVAEKRIRHSHYTRDPGVRRLAQRCFALFTSGPH